MERVKHARQEQGGGTAPAHTERGYNMKSIKVNLPEDFEDYESGNGEGCWAQIDGEAIEAYENDERGNYTATLDNDSYSWNVKHGTQVPIELRGEYRPVVPIAWLRANA